VKQCKFLRLNGTAKEIEVYTAAIRSKFKTNKTSRTPITQFQSSTPLVWRHFPAGERSFYRSPVLIGSGF
jgi:hypothetical protein